MTTSVIAPRPREPWSWNVRGREVRKSTAPKSVPCRFQNPKPEWHLLSFLTGNPQDSLFVQHEQSRCPRPTEWLLLLRVQALGRALRPVCPALFPWCARRLRATTTAYRMPDLPTVPCIPFGMVA